VVLACAYSGVARIQRALSDSAQLACTSGTGVLPLCAQAAAAWQRVDNRDGPPSSLALSSIRALASSMITAIVAGTGRSRWCEISFSPSAAAEIFLRLYPAAQFICLHRTCPDVIRAAIEANPWGLAGAGLGSFTAAYPGSSAAAVAAYWVECTESALDFQAAHPAACHQIRYEDLAGRPDLTTRDMFTFLGLDAASPSVTDGTASFAESGTPLGGAEVPASLLPRPLAERVNRLQQHLGYPPIALSCAASRPSPT
jgi:hypothetical protein